jgi:hypothetical protein
MKLEHQIALENVLLPYLVPTLTMVIVLRPHVRTILTSMMLMMMIRKAQTPCVNHSKQIVLEMEAFIV